MGLVARIVDSPTFYQAISMKEAVSTLINRQRAEYVKIQKVAQELLLIDPTITMKPHEEESEFIIEKWSKEKLRKEVTNCCKNAKETIDLLLNNRTFDEGVIDLTRYQLA